MANYSLDEICKLVGLKEEELFGLQTTEQLVNQIKDKKKIKDEADELIKGLQIMSVRQEFEIGKRLKILGERGIKV
jgi:hypothetical protein